MDRCITYTQAAGAYGRVIHHKCLGVQATREMAAHAEAKHGKPATHQPYRMFGHTISRYVIRAAKNLLISVEDDTPLPGSLRDTR